MLTSCDFFNQYAPAAVKTITVDLFTSCRAMSRDLFPNANIVADIFHVVTQAHCEPQAVLYPTKNDAPILLIAKGNEEAVARTIRKHFDEIINSFFCGFSNGPIEYSNTKIKSN